jgi:peptidoglycan/LPS O-acetylase OafA/YrhL
MLKDILLPGNFPVGIGVLRLLFAVAVLLGHSQEIPGFRFVGGEIAVESFYTISGFYMFMILQDKYKSKINFYVNRFLRLYPMYFVTLLLTVFIYFVYGIGISSLYSVNWESLNLFTKIQFAFVNITMLLTDLGSFMHVNLNNGAVYFSTAYSQSAPGANSFLFIPQAWTLGLEIWFYTLVPFIASIKTRCILCIAAASLCIRFILWGMMYRDMPWSYGFFPSELFFFVMGGACYRVYRWLIIRFPQKLQVYSILASIFILLTSSIINYFGISKLEYETIYFLIFFVCLPFVFHCSRKNRIDRNIGELSYPLYIVHTLVITVVESVGGLYLLEHRLTGVVSTFFAIIASIFLVKCIQNPVESFRRAIARDGVAASVHLSFQATLVWVCSFFKNIKIYSQSMNYVVGLALLCIAMSLFFILPEKLYSKVYFDLFCSESCNGIAISGFGPIERDAVTQKKFCWGQSPVGVVCINSQSEKKYKLEACYDSPFDDQEIAIKLNGTLLGTSKAITRSWMDSKNKISISFTCKPGLNILEILYSDWNGLRTYLAPNEIRPLTAAFQEFKIESMVK